MKCTRRDFLKIATASLLLGPKMLEAQEPFPSGLQDLQYWGPNLRSIWQQTTLHHRMLPELSILHRISGKYALSGEAPYVRNGLLQKTTQLSTDPHSLLFFGHITDAHIVDEESPGRVAAAELYLEQELGVRSAFHPNEDLTLHVLDAMIHTINKIAGTTQMDFLLNTGDCVDSAQQNELAWFLRVLEGWGVNPDSGADEDPVSGPGNDANDMFIPEGLISSLPYYNAVGNHDVLIQGNVPAFMRELYNSIVQKVQQSMTIPDPVGSWSNAVLTPWAKPPDPKTWKPGTIIADATRKTLSFADFYNMHLYQYTTRPCMGFPRSLPNPEYGYYAVYPKPGVPIKLVVLDTALRLGTNLGAITKTEFQEFLLPQLEDAAAKQELVIIASHHPGDSIKTLPFAREAMSQQLGQNPELESMTQELLSNFNDDAGYVSSNEFQEALLSYPNVFLHIAGHKHGHSIKQIGTPERGYWEVQTGSLLTYPQQSRLFEIVYEGNETCAIHTCIVDHASDSPLASYSRKLAYDDCQRVGMQRERIGEVRDRNTILRFQVSPEIAKKL